MSRFGASGNRATYFEGSPPSKFPRDLRSSDPHDPIIRFAPYICIEVLSKDDTLMEIQIRTDEYRAMGVAHIWVIDPVSREAWTATPAGYEALLTGEFTVPGTPIRISLAEAFAELDEMQSPN